MVVGIAMVRDEADVILDTVTRMADQVDQLLIADNGSTDDTRDILEDLATELPLTVLDDPEVGYFQARKMSRLAWEAAILGAEWVVPFDADEVWYSPFGRIADVLAGHPEACIATAELYDHVPTSADPIGTPVARMRWRRREPGTLPKVACKCRPAVNIHQGNHGADYGTTLTGQLVVRHFPYRSAEQFVRKARNGAEAYKATDLPEHQGAHWRQYGQILEHEGPEALEGVFRQWFWDPAPEINPDLIYDPIP